MNVDDLILVSVDDHIVEPPDMFEGRLPQKFRDRAPRVVGSEMGQYSWVFEGQLGLLTTAATAGRAQGERFEEPTDYSQVRPGTYDVHERVRDMSANGVLGSLNFPSFPRFCGQLFAAAAKTDPDLALAVVHAYNDWHLESWAGAYPDRFIPCGLPPLWDPQLMAAEVRRLAARGCHAVTFSMNPYKLGLPSLHDDHWDPFWAACDETETIVCLHIGSGSYEVTTSPDAPVLVRITCNGVSIFPTAADLVWSPALRKFPNLKFALSEGGIGWIPYFLEKADFTYRHHVEWLPEHDFKGELPSDRFRDRIVTCFIEDEVGIENIGRLNPDMVTWECDYPHPDSTWPNSPESAERHLARLGDDELIDKVTHRNAMRIFRFDPFATRPREQCTVGALRREAHDVDVTFVPGRQIDLASLTRGIREQIEVDSSSS